MTQGPESVRFGTHPTDTVLHRFERWARDTPDAPALVAGPDSLTYGQLDARAGRLARRLLAEGLAPGARVAVGTVRQAELVTALLAVLKAGGVYAVVDAEDPRTGRRQLTGAEPDLLLTRAAHRAALDGGTGLRVVRFGAEEADAGDERSEGAPGLPGAGLAGPGRTAAVLFTGAAEPRAVPVGHGLLLAAYEAWAEAVRPTPRDRHLITARTDVTAFAAGWTRALCSGGALVLPARAPWKGEELTETVRAEQVTVLHAGPADVVHLLAPPETPPRPSVPQPRRARGADLPSLRLLAFSGDRLHLDDMAALHTVLRPGVRVLNVYGTTETAGTGTRFELPQLPGPLDGPEERSLLGIPFRGCRAELRNGEIHLTPPGGGDPVPTGDLGLLREDGLLEFRGRLRDRIALPGRSLDPHPVESAIRGHEGIGAVIVNGVDGARGPRRLVAYAAPRPGAPEWPPGRGLPDVEELREHLAGKVPREDIPLRVVSVRALPRTRGGQEDRAALPLPILSAPAARPAGSKSVRPAAGPTGPFPGFWAAGCGGLAVGLAGLILTKVFWPGSTDLTGVPQPWAFLFFLLYLFECVSFGIGLVFLLGGRARMPRRGRGRRLTSAAHLAVAYLLMAWWPQDNFYRLAAKQDWPRQAALVYTFNIPLMIAAAVVAAYVVAKPPNPFDFDD
ncbi:AMP-binding protein [Streptomyces sp. NPDC059193]|uniref:AMP-binding protein n=1 Tax=Streptomyces sp. NPDC059193 TaxID=3346763 RepID=UPI0036993460